MRSAPKAKRLRRAAWLWTLAFGLPARSIAMTYTVVHRTPLDSASARAQGLARLPFAEGLFKTASASATLESPALETPFPFDDLVGSWNAEVPPGGRLEMQARVRAEGGWTDWFSLGASEGGRFHSAPRQESDSGFVDIDTLKLKRRATAFSYRFLLKAPRDPVRLVLAAVTVSDDQVQDPPPFREGPWVTELGVRPRSQMEEQERYKHDICSPTSLAMALEYWGRRLSTVAVAERVKDSETGIFGHWPFNAAAAGEKSLPAYVSRLDSLEDLQNEIAQGRPVVASVTYGPGELTGAPIKKTKGHLLLVIGFAKNGDVIVMDPAAPNRNEARRIYIRREFHRAWRVNKRGLAYLIGPLKGRRMAVGAPVADLWASPRRTEKTVLHDQEHLSQVLYGETVTLRSVRGAWARVLAEEQLDFLKERRWQGYPGWVKAQALSFNLPPPPNVVVRTRQALLQRGQDMIVVSVGTRLSRVSEGRGVCFVRLLDASLAEIPSDSLFVPPAQASEESRSQVIKTAELFLGTSYYWGGRSGVQSDPSIGVDCSGLVNLAYRIHGMNIPRDSHEQKLKSRPVAGRDLRPGDLIFLTDSRRSKMITHVMIYTGGDGVIEARKSSGRVLRSTFLERFGRPLSGIESGDVVLDRTFPKPRERILYFGSYF